MAIEIPQDRALGLYLAMVAGDSPRTSYLEIRWKLADRAGMGQEFVPLFDLDRAARMIVNRAQATDTYVGAAPRTERKGGLDAIERVHCLWIDCDGRESIERVARFRPLPSIVIRSGSDGHAHAYWPLSTAVPPSCAKRANQRLALALNADRAATDAARIMRPPLTWNHKHEPSRAVKCTRLELDTFTLAEVIGPLPDHPDDRPRDRAPREPALTDGPHSADGLVRTVRDAAIGNRNAALHWAACRAAEHALDDTAVEAIRDAAIVNGLPEHEVDRTITSALRRTAA